MHITIRPGVRALVAAAAAAATLVVGLIAVAAQNGSPRAAWAESVVNINPGNVPTAADAPGVSHECDPNQGGGPYANQDVWVFVLPGNHNTSGDFVSLTAFFGANGSVTITAAGDPGNFANGGPSTSKAWIVTPKGWTLTGATAVITGTADFFNLTHTCPGTTASPSPSTSPVGSPMPSVFPSVSPSASPSVSPSASPSASRSVGPPPPPVSPSPSVSPSASPSASPSRSPRPSLSPSRRPHPSPSHHGYGGYGPADDRPNVHYRFFIWP